MKNILIINEDADEANGITELFESQCSKVLYAASIQEALGFFINTELCLIILAAEISTEDDHKLLRAMRKAKTTPILVLSSKADHKERLESLQAGAHAYMGKPYTMEECLAQAQSLMQLYIDLHPKAKECFTLAFGKNLIIDPGSRQVFLMGKEIVCTKKEFDLLLCFASNPGRVFSREQLYDLIWDEQSAYNIDDVVKTHIKTLRQKLSHSQNEYIKNVWGVGYRFSLDDEAEKE